MRHAPLLVVAALLAAVAGGAAHAQFRQPAPPPPAVALLFGLGWGDRPAPGMVREEVKTAPGMEVYRRAGEKASFDGVPLASVHYIFENGLLAGVSIHVAPPQRDALVGALGRAWGAARPLENGRLRWNGPGLRAVLAPHPQGDGAVLNLFPSTGPS